MLNFYNPLVVKSSKNEKKEESQSEDEKEVEIDDIHQKLRKIAQER